MKLSYHTTCKDIFAKFRQLLRPFARAVGNMSVAPLPQQLTMGGMPGERVPGSQHGCTALDDLHNIKIHYNAEV